MRSTRPAYGATLARSTGRWQQRTEDQELPGRVTQVAICIETGDYAASLERWKVYPVLPDADAEAHDQIRVVDESGEDYLYPKEYFRPVELPSSVADRYHAARG